MLHNADVHDADVHNADVHDADVLDADVHDADVHTWSFVAIRIHRTVQVDSYVLVTFQ